MTRYKNDHLNETSKGRNGGLKMTPQKAEAKNKQPMSRPPLQIFRNKEKTGDCRLACSTPGDHKTAVSDKFKVLGNKGVAILLRL